MYARGKTMREIQGLLLEQYGLDEEQLAKFMGTGPWEPVTEFTITQPKALLERIRKVRVQGFAANDSEYIFGVVGAAVPITNKEEQVIAVLTVSAPRSRRTLEDMKGNVPTLKTYADRIGRIL